MLNESLGIKCVSESASDISRCFTNQQKEVFKSVVRYANAVLYQEQNEQKIPPNCIMRSFVKNPCLLSRPMSLNNKVIWHQL
jgi:hypothetical protein